MTVEKFTYIPKGVCSRKMDFEVEDGIVKSLSVEGGCNGNLNGISSIVRGKSIEEVIAAFDGVICGNKPTSCPDQIATALKQYLQK